MQILENKTSEPQQIHFCDGTASTIMPRQSIKVDMNKLFPEEKVRINKFFDQRQDVETEDNDLLIIRRRKPKQSGPQKLRR